MFRILLANFVVEVLPLLLVVAGIVLIVRRRSGGDYWTRYFGIGLVSFPAGIVAYIFASIVAARIRGDGHFYSVPFGGYTVSNNIALGSSILIWIALVFVALAAIIRPKA
jgi:ABC-type dipeptide/oligopeptide/nickel transport system permease component